VSGEKRVEGTGGGDVTLSGESGGAEEAEEEAAAAGEEEAVDPYSLDLWQMICWAGAPYADVC
jgi:hypothetical protein